MDRKGNIPWRNRLATARSVSLDSSSRFSFPSCFPVVLAVGLLVLLARSSYPQSGDFIVSSDMTWPEGVYQLNSLTVNSGATLTLAGGSTVNVVGTVAVTGDSRILLQGKNTTGQVNSQWSGTGVTIHAGNIQIEGGSQITADGQGYGTSLGPGGGHEGDKKSKDNKKVFHRAASRFLM